jgi:hypothetical protein
MSIVMNETRHVTQPVLRQHGGVDLNRSLDFFLAATPDVDLAGYMKALGARTRHVRDWMLFLERYPLVVGPVSTEPPFEVGFDTTTAARAGEVFTAQRLLIAVNLLGLPAVARAHGTSQRPAARRARHRLALPRGPVPGRRRGDRGAARPGDGRDRGERGSRRSAPASVSQVAATSSRNRARVSSLALGVAPAGSTRNVVMPARR